MKKYSFKIVLLILLSVILSTFISCQSYTEQNVQEMKNVKDINQENNIIYDGTEIPIELISKEIVLKW
jgi:hypothetical protein